MYKFFVAVEELPEQELLVEEIAPELIVEQDPEEIEVANEEVMEAEDISADIDNDIAETGRVEDIAEGLESLCEIIKRIDTHTPANVALIKLAANMAVSGTKLPAQTLFSANESFEDLNVTVEGIKDKIASIGAGIAQTAATVAGKVMNFIKKIMSAYERYSEKLTVIKAKLAEVKSAKTAKSVSVNIRGNGGMFINGKSVTDAKHYLDSLKTTNKAMTGFSELFANQSMKAGTDCVELLKLVTKDKEKFEEGFLKVFKSYDEDFFGKLIKLPGMAQVSTAEVENEYEVTADDNEAVFKNTTMLGNIEIFIVVPKPNSFDKTNVKEIKDNINGYYLSTHSTSESDDAKANIVFNDVQISYVEQLIAECEKTLQISKNYSSKQFKIAQFFNSAKTTALFAATAAAVGGVVAAGGSVAGAVAGATVGKLGAVGAGAAGLTAAYGAGKVGGKVISAAFGSSTNIKLINNINFNLSYMSKATWRHSNLMLSTGLGICDKILSSKEWTVA